MAGIQKTNPHFWFSNNAEEAVGLTRVFSTTQRQAAFSRYTKEGFDVHHMPEGTVMSIGFTIEGQGFLVLHGGPIFNFGGRSPPGPLP